MERKKIKQFAGNPRKITLHQTRDLEESLLDLGDLSGNIYNINSGQWVGGNQRSKIFNNSNEIEGEYDIEYIERREKPDKQGTVALGFVHWKGGRYSYREVEWDEETEKRANIAANKMGGEWDFEALRENWDREELKMGTGFNEKEINEIYGKVVNGVNLGEVVEGEEKWSVELGRSADYIVLKFDNDVDFLQAKTLLGLESTYAKRQNGKEWARGIGRVVNGAEAIEKIRNSK